MPGEPALGDGVITLRVPVEGDLEAIDAGLRDPDVVHFLGSPPGTASEVLERNRTRAQDGSPTFAIRDRADRFLGLAWINRRAPDPATGAIGYWLLPGARGQGHATRAVRLLVDHAIRDLGLRRLILVTEPANVRSRAVAERAGFEQLETRAGHGEIDGRSIDVVVYSLPLGDA
jgi:ribosomal-protein-alanine N-acetyltransferase